MDNRPEFNDASHWLTPPPPPPRPELNADSPWLAPIGREVWPGGQRGSGGRGVRDFFYTSAEVAALLAISQSTARKNPFVERLGGKKLYGRWFFPKDNVDLVISSLVAGSGVTAKDGKK